MWSLSSPSLSGWELSSLCPVGAGFHHGLPPLFLFLLLGTSEESLTLSLQLPQGAQSLVSLVVMPWQPPQPEAHQPEEARHWFPLLRQAPHHVLSPQLCSTPSALRNLNEAMPCFTEVSKPGMAALMLLYLLEDLPQHNLGLFVPLPEAPCDHTISN